MIDRRRLLLTAAATVAVAPSLAYAAASDADARLNALRGHGLHREQQIVAPRQEMRPQMVHLAPSLVHGRHRLRRSTLARNAGQATTRVENDRTVVLPFCAVPSWSCGKRF